MRIGTRLLFTFTLLWLPFACAVIEKDNRYVTEVIDENIAPESSGAKLALAPIAIPLGLVSMLIDGLIIHPLISIPKALDDATVVFTEIEFMGPLEIIAFPMRLISYPVFFVGDWLIRISLPIDFN